MIELSLDNFHLHNKPYTRLFNFKKLLCISRYTALEQKFKDYVDKDEAFERLKLRTSAEYYNEVYSAQMSALSLSESLFPAYKFIFPDVLMDDWLSIICPHKKGRRDHSLHQPLTSYIVSELLGMLDKDNVLKVKDETLCDYCVDKLINDKRTLYLRHYFDELYQKEFPIKNDAQKKNWARAVFEQASIMASLFHDIGYPWQFMNLLGKATSNIELNGGFSHQANYIYDQICSRLLVYPFYGYSESCVKHPLSNSKNEVLKQIESASSKTHGFPGALAFTYLNDVISKYPVEYNFEGATVRFIQDWASVAIMMHDMASRYRNDKGEVLNPHYRIRIDTDPLSCLISMADILEEFGRPLADFRSYTKGVVTRYNYPCTRTTIDVTGNVMKITYLYKEDCNLSKFRSIREKEVYSYFNEIDGYLDLSPVGIERVECNVDYDKDN